MAMATWSARVCSTAISSTLKASAFCDWISRAPMMRSPTRSGMAASARVSGRSGLNLCSGFLQRVVHHHHRAGLGDFADDRFRADSPGMRLGFHHRASLAGGLLQPGEGACFIGDEDGGVVIAESFAHQVHGPGEDGVEIQGGGDQAADIRGGRQIGVAPL